MDSAPIHRSLPVILLKSRSAFWRRGEHIRPAGLLILAAAGSACYGASMSPPGSSLLSFYGAVKLPLLLFLTAGFVALFN